MLSSGVPAPWPLAERGLHYAGSRRDLTWAYMAIVGLEHREAADPDLPGIPVDSPERREISRILLERLAELGDGAHGLLQGFAVFESREEILEKAPDFREHCGFRAGEYARAAEAAIGVVPKLVERGEFSNAALRLMQGARCQAALGDLAASESSFGRAKELAARVDAPPGLANMMASVPLEHAFVRAEGLEPMAAMVEALLAQDVPESRWLHGVLHAAIASIYARTGRGGNAIAALRSSLPTILRGPGWEQNYPALIWYAAETLWTLGRTDFVETIERNLREKVLAPDFCYPQTDAHLALARLCALQRRYDEAVEWFAKARQVLDEQGARPLRAITDFDEATMYARRGAPGDADRARSLLAAARPQFEAIGMPGWLRQADALAASLGT